MIPTIPSAQKIKRAVQSNFDYNDIFFSPLPKKKYFFFLGS
jgi:hypothetical protein